MRRALRTLRTLWEEPAVADPPGPMRRDWVLAGVVLICTATESVVRDDVPWRGLSVVLLVVFALTLPWRRRHPLPIMAALFTASAAATLVSVLTDAEWEAFVTTGFILVLPYALARWGSGRQVVLGVIAPLASAGLSVLEADTTGGDLIGATVVLLFPVVVGAEVRTLGRARRQEIDQARLAERELLARELHDSVAHHVSAIAVQAQAGRAVAPTRPEAPLEALVVIEEEASRTLAEMRSIVGALRNHDDDPRAAELAPQAGVADLPRLADLAHRATHGAGGLRVDVELHGDLAGLRPSVDTALYRLAQESITNAVRHARNASLVAVRVEGEPDCVRLTVRDDGDPSSGVPVGEGSGYGLVGMVERATLLGGTVDAGPDGGRGWTVTAVLPRHAAMRDGDGR